MEFELKADLIRRNISGIKNKMKKEASEDSHSYRMYRFHLKKAKMALKRLAMDAQSPHKEPVK